MTFKTEAKLCKTFIEHLPKAWTPYPETSGWDILLVHDTGVQIGVEAKLKLNAKVIEQAAERIAYYHATDAGPDFRSILVPYGTGGTFLGVCRLLGITVIGCVSEERYLEVNRYHIPKLWFGPELPPGKNGFSWRDEWFDTAPVKRHELPDYIPKVDAGTPSPLILSSWKIGAMRLCVLMERTGYLCRSDFTALKISISRWMPSSTGWLGLTNQRGVYTKGTRWPGETFRSEHPDTYQEMEADFETWCPKGRVKPNLPELFEVQK